MKTIEYLDTLKNRHSLTSDYQLAKLLETSTPVISHYRTGKRVMDDYTAAKVAELLELEPLEVIAAANAERERDPNKRAYWEKLVQSGVRTAASIALAVITVLAPTPSPVHAATSYDLHYVNYILGLWPCVCADEHETLG